MLSAEILKEIKQIMRYKLTDVEKCVMIKSFCNNVVDSDAIRAYVDIKKGL